MAWRTSHWLVLVAPASFLAFQMDGIFVGAMCSRAMRDAMILSAACFVMLVFAFDEYGLHGILAAFTIYLGLRGLTLQFSMKQIHAMVAQPASNDGPAK